MENFAAENLLRCRVLGLCLCSISLLQQPAATSTLLRTMLAFPACLLLCACLRARRRHMVISEAASSMCAFVENSVSTRFVRMYNSTHKTDEISLSSFRSLCIMTTIGKLSEKMLTPRLQQAMEAAGDISSRQYGFRKAYGTSHRRGGGCPQAVRKQETACR